jgi:Carboxypeptidase regulatory-like domain
MKFCFVLTMAFAAILSQALRCEAGEPPASRGVAASPVVGVYIAKNETACRIELLPDGSYYAALPSGHTVGTYLRTKDAVVCTDKEDGDKTRFALNGDSLIDPQNNQWVRRETLHKFPWKETVPVSIAVIDDKTHAPITEFAYTYRIKKPDAEFDPLLVRPIAVRSPKGAFTLLVPKSCQIELHLEGGMIIGGYPWFEKYALPADMKQRRIEAPMRTGIVVEGVIVDAHTKAPIAGARVSPIIFTPPHFTPDRDHCVKTDAQGRFQIRGVDPFWGISVWHADYVELKLGGFEKARHKIAEKTYTERVELQSGDTIAGTVKDASGKPLADVTVSDGAGKSVQSRADGSFTLRGPIAWGGNQSYQLSFDKDGYLGSRKNVAQNPPPRSPLSIALEQQPALTGRVFGRDGRPVALFTVVAGPGPEPRDWCCSSQTVVQADGQFSVRVRTDFDYDKGGKVWAAVKAPGFAIWENVIDSWQGTKTISVQLKAGVSVRGSIQVTEKSGGNPQKVVAALLPARLHKEDYTRENSKRQELGRMQTPLDDRGAFRFDHVPPGSYLLAVSGSGISPIGTALIIGQADVDVGRLTTTGKGSIIGIVYEAKMLCEGDKCRLDPKRGPWAFAEGHVSFSDSSGRSNDDEFEHLKPIPFKTDEHGRFRLDNIPVGNVSVDIPFHATADIIAAHTRTAHVFEGRTTEVRFFDPSGTWDLSCHFAIGDGSRSQFLTGTGLSANRKVQNVTTRPPMFRVELVPSEPVPTSYSAPDWESLNERNDIVLDDVHPGKYHVVIGDWVISRGFLGTLAEQDVDVKSRHSALTVPLGAGCITGAVEWTRQFRYMIHVLAVGKKSHVLHHARCDDQGNFCVRYLFPDEYTLYAHDEAAGWSHLGSVTVANDAREIGSHTLVAGGTITGKLPPEFGTDRSINIVATNPQGLAIEMSDPGDALAKTFTISNLWPGQWTVSMTKKHKLLDTKTVVLPGADSVRCDFGAK